MHAIIFQLLYVFQYNFLWKNYRHIYIEVQGIWMTNINSWSAGYNKGYTLRLPYTLRGDPFPSDAACPAQTVDT